MTCGPVVVRPARPDDAALIVSFIRELAEYERLLDAVEVEEAGLTAALFGPAPRVFCEIAEAGGGAGTGSDAPVGFALWFYTFSTFVGRHGIWLEDLYVRPQARGSGVGRALLRELARRCVDERLGRLEWAVLDWNEPAVGFYDALGASALDDWTTRRLDGDALRALATS